GCPRKDSEPTARKSFAQLVAAEIRNARFECLLPNSNVFLCIFCIHKIDCEYTFQFIVAGVPLIKVFSIGTTLLRKIGPFVVKCTKATKEISQRDLALTTKAANLRTGYGYRRTGV